MSFHSKINISYNFDKVILFYAAYEMLYYTIIKEKQSFFFIFYIQTMFENFQKPRI